MLTQNSLSSAMTRRTAQGKKIRIFNPVPVMKQQTFMNNTGSISALNKDFIVDSSKMVRLRANMNNSIPESIEYERIIVLVLYSPLRAQVAQSEAPVVARSWMKILASGPAQVNQAFQPFGAGELTPDWSGRIHH